MCFITFPIDLDTLPKVVFVWFLPCKVTLSTAHTVQPTPKEWGGMCYFPHKLFGALMYGRFVSPPPFTDVVS